MELVGYEDEEAGRSLRLQSWEVHYQSGNSSKWDDYGITVKESKGKITVTGMGSKKFREEALLNLYWFKKALNEEECKILLDEFFTI